MAANLTALLFVLLIQTSLAMPRLKRATWMGISEDPQPLSQPAQSGQGVQAKATGNTNNNFVNPFARAIANKNKINANANSNVNANANANANANSNPALSNNQWPPLPNRNQQPIGTPAPAFSNSAPNQNAVNAMDQFKRIWGNGGTQPPGGQFGPQFGSTNVATSNAASAAASNGKGLTGITQPVGVGSQQGANIDILKQLAPGMPGMGEMSSKQGADVDLNNPSVGTSNGGCWFGACTNSGTKAGIMGPGQFGAGQNQGFNLPMLQGLGGPPIGVNSGTNVGTDIMNGKVGGGQSIGAGPFSASSGSSFSFPGLDQIGKMMSAGHQNGR